MNIVRKVGFIRAKPHLNVGYQHFHNAVANSVTGIGAAGPAGPPDIAVSNIDKVLLGVERTFYDGLLSLQFQVPFSAEISRDMFADIGSVASGPTAPTAKTTEFGNLSLAIKALLFEDRCRELKISGGILLEMPTQSQPNA